MPASLLRFFLNLRMALQSLMLRPGRSALTLLGIVIGIVALVSMMSLIGGLKTSVVNATQPLGSGIFQVQKEPRFMSRRKRRRVSKLRKSFTVADVRTLEERLVRTRSVGGEMWSWGNTAKTPERQTNPVVGLAGVMPAFWEANGLAVEAGRAITDNDIEHKRSVAVIGADILETLFPAGESAAIGSTIRVKGRAFEVVGVLARRASLFGAAWRNSIVAIPVSTFERSFGFRSLHITLAAADPENLEPAMEEAISLIRWMRRVEPGAENDFEIFNNDSVLGQLDGFAIILFAAAAAVCVLALLVGGIGVMNIMLVSVTERTREIGIRKALGARPRTILGQFVSEAVALTSLGGLIGVGLAGLTVMIVRRVLDLPATIPLWAVLVALGSSTLIGLVAGIYPAARAARLDPIDALRYE